MPYNKPTTSEKRSVSMDSLHWVTVEAYAKDQGFPSVSSALRRIIDEWVELKQAVQGRETDYYELEGRFSELWAAASNALQEDGDGYDVRGQLEATLTRVRRRRMTPHLVKASEL